MVLEVELLNNHDQQQPHGRGDGRDSVHVTVAAIAGLESMSRLILRYLSHDPGAKKRKHLSAMTNPSHDPPEGEQVEQDNKLEEQKQRNRNKCSVPSRQYFLLPKIR